MTSPAPSMQQLIRHVDGTRLKYWGWGDEDRPIDQQLLKAVLQRLSTLFDTPLKQLYHPQAASDIKLRAPRFAAPGEWQQYCTIDNYARLLHHFGKDFASFGKAVQGLYSLPVDYVLYPATNSEVLQILQHCSKNRIAVIPFGGGSSVVFGYEPDAYIDSHYNGCVSVDMKRFNKLISVNETDRTIRVQAGMFGPQLDEALKPYGLTLRHYPQSYQYSTVGGWVVTRSGGHYCTHVTHIDEVVSAVQMVTPSGIIETRILPKSGAGPDPQRLVCGSEGILGIVTECTLRVQVRPKYRAGATVFFEEFYDAVNACRSIIQATDPAIHPANLRLIDGMEATNNQLSQNGEATLIIAFETHVVDDMNAPLNAALRICKQHNGQWKGTPKTEAEQTSVERASTAPEAKAAVNWRNAFISMPFIRDHLNLHGLIIDTFESACPWSNFPTLHENVMKGIRELIDTEFGGHGFVTCRFTHIYSDGPAPYWSFTILGKGSLADRVQQWQRIKDVGNACILKYGGTATHHHAVGKMHAATYQRESDPLFLQMIAAAKQRVDPNWILNPNVLIPAPEATTRSSL